MTGKALRLGVGGMLALTLMIGGSTSATATTAVDSAQTVTGAEAVTPETTPTKEAPTKEELEREKRRASELQDQVNAQTQAVADTQAQVDLLAVQVEEALKAAEAARVAAEAATRQAGLEALALEKAKDEEEKARNTLNSYAAQNYRNMGADSLSGVTLLLDNRGPAEAIHGAKVREHVGMSQADATTALEQAKVAQASATRKANDAKREAVEQAAVQDQKLTEAESLQAQQETLLAQLEDQLVQTKSDLTGAKADVASIAEALAAAEAARLRAQARLAEAATSAEFQRAAQAAAANQIYDPKTYCTQSDVSKYPNGRIPSAALCPLSTAPGHVLTPAAAAAFDAMSRAYFADTGSYICVTDSYRTYEAQVAVRAAKPGLAAVPGTSNHGWGRAVDLCGGINTFGTPAHQWMRANSVNFGWFHPAWAGQSGSKPEAWHWEFAGI